MARMKTLAQFAMDDESKESEKGTFSILVGPGSVRLGIGGGTDIDMDPDEARQIGAALIEAALQARVDQLRSVLLRGRGVMG